MSQNHFTLRFPLKSPGDAKLIAEQLPPLMPELFRANDRVGTIHYSRFTVLSEKTLLFLGDFDGEFVQLMADLAKLAGPAFDAIFQHVDQPPPTPVAVNGDAFVKWTSAHLVDAVNLYTAYPSVTANSRQRAGGQHQSRALSCRSCQQESARTRPDNGSSKVMKYSQRRRRPNWHLSFLRSLL
jgi:hypothetical protein